MFYKQKPVKITGNELALVVRYFTVKSKGFLQCRLFYVLENSGNYLRCPNFWNSKLTSIALPLITLADFTFDEHYQSL